MLKFLKKLDNVYVRFFWVFVVPLVITILIFVYFFRWYESPGIGVSIIEDKKTPSLFNASFDPIEIRNLLPNSVGQNLKFVLCLSNRNKILDSNGNVSDPNLWPVELKDEKRTIGAMAIHASKISDLNLYEERGGAECIPVDMEALVLSDVTSDINNGPLFLSLDGDNTKNFIDGKPAQASFRQMSIDLSGTWLYARMQWNHLVFILLGVYVAWFGFVLLLKNVFGFCFLKNKI